MIKERHPYLPMKYISSLFGWGSRRCKSNSQSDRNQLFTLFLGGTRLGIAGQGDNVRLPQLGQRLGQGGRRKRGNVRIRIGDDQRTISGYRWIHVHFGYDWRRTEARIWATATRRGRGCVGWVLIQSGWTMESGEFVDHPVGRMGPNPNLTPIRCNRENVRCSP